MLRRMRSMMLIAAAVAAAPAGAELRSEVVAYEHDGQALQGHVYWDDAVTGPRPGVLVVHEWWGLNDYAKARARELAGLGYVAFAADMYGTGRVTEHPEQAGEWAKLITDNVAAWRDRARTALELLAARPHVDRERLAAIGYCFGGSTVMQLAYSGADLDAVASFHGSLPVADAREVRASVLIAHGAEDSFVPADRVADFQQALSAAGVDWQMVYYGGAVHSFTVPGADAHGMQGVAYDARADRRSWALLRDFLGEVFTAGAGG